MPGVIIRVESRFFADILGPQCDSREFSETSGDFWVKIRASILMKLKFWQSAGFWSSSAFGMSWKYWEPQIHQLQSEYTLED